MRAGALLALVVVLAGGCGGTAVDPAQFMPRDTVRFFTAETDSDWQRLGRAFVGRVAARGDAFAVGIRRSGERIVVARTDGTWNAQARDDSLADDGEYRRALADVPADARAHGWIRGNAVKPLVRAIPGQVSWLVGSSRSVFRVTQRPQPVVSLALLQFRWGVGWLTDDDAAIRAETDGLPRAISYRVRSVETFTNPYEPALFDEIPADVVAFADFPLPPGTFRLLPTLPARLTAMFPKSGFVLSSQLDAVTGGETALYWRKGGEVTLITSPPDLTAAEEALAELSAQLPYRVFHTTLGGQLVVSTRRSGLDAFRGNAPKLSSRDLGFPKELNAALWIGPDAPPSLGGRPLTAWLVRDGADPTLTVRFGR